MRKYAEIRAEFDAQYAALPPQPVKSYIAYHNGEVLRTEYRSIATKFSPKGLIETIEPDKIKLRQWRSAKLDLDKAVVAQWKKELYSEFSFSAKVAERIYEYVCENADGGYDAYAESFYEVATMVESCIAMEKNARS